MCINNLIFTLEIDYIWKYKITALHKFSISTILDLIGIGYFASQKYSAGNFARAAARKPVEALTCAFMINNTCGYQKIDVRGFLGASNIDLIYIQNLLKLSFRGC